MTLNDLQGHLPIASFLPAALREAQRTGI